MKRVKPKRGKVKPVMAWSVVDPDGAPVVWSCTFYRGQSLDKAARCCMGAFEYEARDKWQRRALLRSRGYRPIRVRITPARERK